MRIAHEKVIDIALNQGFLCDLRSFRQYFRLF
jgi:hypothetical protein